MEKTMIATGIFFAVHDEAAEVLADPFYGWEKKDIGLYGSTRYPLALTISGIGKAFASYYLYPLARQSERILIMGTSGGLSDERVGSVYLIDEFIEYDMDVTGLGFPRGVTPFCGMKDPVIRRRNDQYLSDIQKAATAVGVELLSGRAISGDAFINSDEKSRSLEKELSASVVDMESAAIAKLCWSTGRDVLAVRYVSDNANHESAVDWKTNVKLSAGVFNAILKKYAALRKL